MATSTQQNHLPEFYAEEIHRIGSNLADNFKRAFNNEGIRLRKAHKSIELENVGFSIESIYVHFSDIRINYPEFRVTDLNIDLEQGMIDYKLFIGRLSFGNKMQSITITPFKEIYTRARANLVWTLHNLTINGSAGIKRVEDSFVATNNRNLHFFEFGEIEQFVDDDHIPERTSFCDEEGMTLFKLIQSSVYATLSSKIKRQIDVITEFSVSELLLDERGEIAKYDEYLRQRTMRANLLVDAVLNRAKATGLLTTAGTITTKMALPYRRSNATTRHLLLAKGEIQGMHTCTRAQNCSIQEDSRGIAVYAELVLLGYKFHYKYHTKYDGFEFAGNITATVRTNRWMVEVVKRRGKPSFVTVTSGTIKDIEINCTNLGSLNWLSESLRTTLSGHVKMETDKVRAFLEERLQSAALELPINKCYLN